MSPPRQPGDVALAPSTAGAGVRRGVTDAAGPLILAGLAAIAWANALDTPFVFDDEISVLRNPSIRTLWPPWRALWPPERRLMVGRPVPNFTLAVNYALGGLNPWGYHVFNVCVHVLSGFVLLGIVRRTLPRARLPPALATAAPALALTVAAVWLVHPLQTDAVTYVTQRTEELMGLSFLLTLYAAIRAWDAPRPWTALAVTACALGMASKEPMASAPVMVALYDRIFRAPSLVEAWARRRRLYVGLAATWVIMAGLLSVPTHTDTAGFGKGAGPVEYALTEAGVLVEYLHLALWPNALCLDHGVALARTAGQIVVPGLAILTLLAGTAWALARWRPIGFLGAWFFAILAPTSSIVPIVTEVMAERRMYLPLAAIVSLVVVGVALAAERLVRGLPPDAAGRRRLALLGRATAVGLVLVLTAATVRRNAVYASEIDLLADSVRKHPDNYRAHSNLATLLTGAGRLDEAAAHLREAIRLEPRYANAYYNMGTVFLDQERWEDAIAEYERALRLEPWRADVHLNLGTALLSLGRLGEAARHYGEAVRLDPSSAVAHNNLGRALLNEGQIEAATAEFTEAIRLDPTLTEAQENLRDARAARADPVR